MIVQNYIPDPIEIPNNVAQGPYKARIRFIRTIAHLHLLTVALVACLFFLPWPAVGWVFSLALWVGGTLTLNLVRVARRGHALEIVVMRWALPAILVLAAFALSQAYDAGIPVWALLATPVVCWLYTLAAGWDFSFVGLYVLGLITSSFAIVVPWFLLDVPSETVRLALFLNFAYLSYHVYDWNAILHRRRVGEELAGVADLYRDLLNFPGYFVRCWRHWQRYKIWSVRR